MTNPLAVPIGMSRRKLYGRKVHVHAYLPLEMYQALKGFAEPGDDRWESATVRRALREWLLTKGVELGKGKTVS